MARLVRFIAVVVLFLSCAVVLSAQDAKENSQDKPAAEKNPHPGQPGWVPQPYRLDFSFYELEDGKKINTRHYSLDLTAGSSNELKIGTRVPVPIGGGTNYQYMDVGTRIWADLVVEGGGELQLNVKSEVSNLDMSGATHDHSQAPPIVRQIQINGTTMLVTGKPILIGSMDDPNSNRQFQLEVTATKLR